MNHLALLIPGLDRIGGAEQQVLLLAKGMHARGWRVSVIALTGSGGAAVHELTAAGIFFLSLHMRKGIADPRGWLRLHRWLEQERPDVLHAHLPHATWMARWSRLVLPWLHVIDTLHSAATGGLDRQIGYRMSNWLTDTVTAVSEGVAETHRRAKLVPLEKLNVVPNGIDTTIFRPDNPTRQGTRRRLGLDAEFLWFASGRLEPVKDYPTLLKAFAQIEAPARLLIAGNGPQQAKLETLAIQLGIEQKVHFLGFISDILPYLQAADGYVLASKWEGLPMGVLEAAACALPAVATDVPGSRQAIQHGLTGRLAQAGSATALARTMQIMMEEEPGQRQSIGLRARQMVCTRYSLERVLNLWEKIYRSHAPEMRKPPVSVREVAALRQRKPA